MIAKRFAGKTSRNLPLEAISAKIDPGAHAVLMLDQAGGHLTPKLIKPSNITIMALPPRAPELSPTENIWRFMRDDWLSNRVFKNYDGIVVLRCDASNKLVDQPRPILSIRLPNREHA